MAETSVVGIWQGDIIIKSAIELSIKELRAHPEMIDDVLASLPQDEITSDRYGSVTISQCKKWFLAADIDILLGLRFKYWEKPCVIAVELGSENENESTLGDKNYDNIEDAPNKPGFKRCVESLHADASYTIAVFASGEPELMLFLQSLVLYQLLRRKEDLLDARGFSVSKFSMSTASLVNPDSREMVYLRTIQLTGKVRHGWAKREGAIITSVPVATGTNASVATSFDDPNWENGDILGGMTV